MTIFFQQKKVVLAGNKQNFARPVVHEVLEYFKPVAGWEIGVEGMNNPIRGFVGFVFHCLSWLVWRRFETFFSVDVRSTALRQQKHRNWMTALT